MKYRRLGRTGLSVSEIGVGGHEYRRRRFVADGRFTELDPNRPQILQRALDAGINYFDTTFLEESQSLGATLKDLGVQRDAVHINAMSVHGLKKAGELSDDKLLGLFEADVAARLSNLATDYIDIFCVCSIEEAYNREHVERCVAVLRRLQEAGTIRYIGGSGHDRELIARIIREYDPFDMVMTKLNYPLGQSTELMAAVRDKNVGLVAMKAFAWDYYGLSFIPVRSELIQTFGLNGVSVAQMALRWVLQHEEVATVVSAVNSIEEMADNAAAGDLGNDHVDGGVLEACRTYPHQVEAMIDLIDHPFQDIRDFALGGVKEAMGEDFGSDKERYRRAWRAKNPT